LKGQLVLKIKYYVSPEVWDSPRYPVLAELDNIWDETEKPEGKCHILEDHDRIGSPPPWGHYVQCTKYTKVEITFLSGKNY
jgi:hypothetical protein